MDKLNSTPPYAVDAQNEYQTQLSQRKIIEAIEHELSSECFAFGRDFNH